MPEKVDSEFLKDHLPEGTYPFVEQWFKEKPVQLKVTRPRVTKQGDFRSPFQGKPARITVNGNLNAFAFFITLVHEMAHYETWVKHKNNVLPHGREWKTAFRELMEPFIADHTFPHSVKAELVRYMKNPAAATCTDKGLYLALRNYDDEDETTILLRDIQEGATFSIQNGRTFIKGRKKRTRFLCTEIRNKKQYLINQLAHVKTH